MPKALYVREDAIIKPLDSWLGRLTDPDWLAAAQQPKPIIEAQHANLHAQLAEIDKATTNLVSAIEAGTDPAIINPRLSQLRSEREMVRFPASSARRRRSRRGRAACSPTNSPTSPRPTGSHLPTSTR